MTDTTNDTEIAYRVVQRVAAVVVGAFLIGCDSPSPNSMPTAPVQSTAIRSLEGRRPGHRDRQMVEFARLIPGFGGLYLSFPSLKPGERRDPRGPVQANTYLTVAGDAKQARKAVRERLESEGYSVASVRIIPASYEFQQLQQWRDKLGLAIRPQGLGIVSLDADEANNQVVVGVETETAAATVHHLLTTATTVPGEAVTIRVFGRVTKRQASNLQSTFRPTIPGGVVISGFEDCTLGFNVFQDGAHRFTTASHCSSIEAGYDGSSFRQNIAGSVVGQEYSDPTPHPASTCWYNWPCRYSDVTMVTYSPSSLSEFGKIAATTNQTGSINIDPNRPRLRLIGVRRGIYVGNVVDKIGAFGGWTYGNVTGTCVDWIGYGGAASGYYDLLCVDAANYMDSGGDSGAPILIWYLDDRAEIAGIHDAINGSGERIFSPIEGIEADFGALGPVF
ncbi:MAG: hypothetical protein ACR2NS_08445 [Gemmatimonadaceae bacterium]